MAGGTLLAGGTDTDGRFCLIHTVVGPGDEVPLHRHDSADESFYVVTGSLRVTCGEDSFEVGARDFAHLPAGLPHRYVAGSDGAEFLIHAAPAGLEEFFADWDASGDVVEAGRRHGIEFLG